MVPMGDNRVRGVWPWLLAAAVVSVAFGCEDSSEEVGGEDATAVEEESVESAEMPVEQWQADESLDLRDPPEKKRRDLVLSESKKYPACRELLEEDGEARARLLPDREDESRALTIAGCQPEASVRREGRWYIAYKLAGEETESGDLRMVVYEDGELVWHGRMDRSQHADSFSAQYRSSFITPLEPRLVCAGTLWEGGTQAACWKSDGSEKVWSGELDFWSALPMQGLETSLHAADISGITRRYPYSGAEMRRIDFEHRGGHGALYMTDGERLMFVPPTEAPKRMTTYSLESMEPTWRVELPGHPDPGYNRHVHPRHDLGMLKVDGTVYGFTTRSGELRWALEVGEDRPKTAASGELVYVLLRRGEEPNLLYALQPDSAAIEWYAPVPTGTLHVDWVDGTLTIRSVRAVQRVTDVR
jgi:hypothetical protein